MMPAEEEETYTNCQRCKRTYPEPCSDLLCGECETRCPICGSSGRGCQNPDEFMLAAQSMVYNTFMIKHRQAGDELWWFSVMDKANQATGRQKHIKAYRLWCNVHRPESAELIPADPRCSVKPGEATCEYPDCTLHAYWEY